MALVNHGGVKGSQGQASYEDMGVLPVGTTKVFPVVVPERHLYIIEIRTKTGKVIYYKVGRTNDIHTRVKTL